MIIYKLLFCKTLLLVLLDLEQNTVFIFYFIFGQKLTLHYMIVHIIKKHIILKQLPKNEGGNMKNLKGNSVFSNLGQT